MAQSNCFVCPGGARIWISYPDAGDDGVPTTWSPVPHTLSVQIEPSIEEPTEIRTSDTGGNKVAVGTGATSYKLNVTSALNELDWLYGYILQDDATFGRSLAGAGETLWFAIDWSTTNVPKTALGGGVSLDTPATIDYVDGVYTVARQDNDFAIYMKGTVEPGGYGIDNDSTDPVRAEWSVNISAGPFFPETGSGETVEAEGTAAFPLT